MQKTLFNSSFRSHKSSVVEHALPPLFPNTGRGGTDYSAPDETDTETRTKNIDSRHDCLTCFRMMTWQKQKKHKKTEPSSSEIPLSIRDPLENLSKRKLL